MITIKDLNDFLKISNIKVVEICSDDKTSSFTIHANDDSESHPILPNWMENFLIQNVDVKHNLTSNYIRVEIIVPCGMDFDDIYYTYDLGANILKELKENLCKIREEIERLSSDLSKNGIDTEAYDTIISYLATRNVFTMNAMFETRTISSLMQEENSISNEIFDAEEKLKCNIKKIMHDVICCLDDRYTTFRSAGLEETGGY